MQITSSQIADEITKKLELVRKHPRSHLVSSNCSKSCINHEAICHSLRIEEPRTSSRSHHGKEQQKLYDNMLSAFYWGRGNIVVGNLTENFIKELAGRIDPVYHSSGNAQYRSVMESVRPQGATWTPTYPDKIPLDMSRLIQGINTESKFKDVKSILDASSYAHLHLVRVHPFGDTNGRTSRMLQNLMLNKLGLSSATIYEGERFSYFQLLDDAINGWRERTGSHTNVPSGGERSFYNFMAGKVSTTLDKTLDNL